MNYLETLAKLTAHAEANKSGFRNWWESTVAAQIKFHNFAMSSKWLLGQDFTPVAEPIVLTAEERAAEETLNEALNAAYDPKDRGATSDRQFRKVLSWIETTDLGDAVLMKICPTKKQLIGADFQLPAKLTKAVFHE